MGVRFSYSRVSAGLPFVVRASFLFADGKLSPAPRLDLAPAQPAGHYNLATMF